MSKYRIIEDGNGEYQVQEGTSVTIHLPPWGDALTETEWTTVYGPSRWIEECRRWIGERQIKGIAEGEK